MPSQILNTVKQNDKKFSLNFEISNYDSSINNFPILDIWTDLTLNLKQEEKNNAYLYLYHEIKRTDSLESISRYYYNTDDYWWLVLVANDSPDPFDFISNSLDNGASIKIIKSEFLLKVLKLNNTSDIVGYLKGINAGR